MALEKRGWRGLLLGSRLSFSSTFPFLLQLKPVANCSQVFIQSACVPLNLSSVRICLNGAPAGESGRMGLSASSACSSLSIFMPRCPQAYPSVGRNLCSATVFSMNNLQPDRPACIQISGPFLAFSVTVAINTLGLSKT